MRRSSRAPQPARLVLGLPVTVAAAYAGLFLVAFGVYTALWPEAPVIQGDSLQYLEVAEDLRDFRPTRLHDRAPGYPLLLRLTGFTDQSARTLFHVSLLLHFASVWLLAVPLRAAGISDPRWLVAFAGLLLLPWYVEPAALIMTENLAQITLVVGVAALVVWLSQQKPLALAAAAAAFGGATLIRPVYVLLGVAIAAGVALLPGVLLFPRLTRRALHLTAVVVTIGSLLVAGAFSWMNYSRFGYFGISPLFGFHFSTKTILFVERLPDEYAVVRELLIRERAAELVKRGSTHTGSQTIWEARAELAAVTGLTTPELSSYLTRMNLTLVRRAPVEYLQDVARSVATYWFPAAGPLGTVRSTAVRWLGTGLHVLVVGFLFLHLTVLTGFAAFDASLRLTGAPAGMLSRLRVTPAQAIPYLLAGIVVLYTMFVTCVVDIGEPRQRRATDVLILFMCVLALSVWRRTVSWDRDRESARCDR